MSSTSTNSGHVFSPEAGGLTSGDLQRRLSILEEDNQQPPIPSIPNGHSGSTEPLTNGSTSAPRGVISSEDSFSPSHETDYTTVHYYRHLGPTGIVPGHKKISLKARQNDLPSVIQLNGHRTSEPGPDDQTSPLPLFDSATGLPVKALLPVLTDKYFEYYGNIFCFMNRGHVESLIRGGQLPAVLVSTMSALASRFCGKDIFTAYFPQTSKDRESWEYSGPFLEKAKSMVMSAISLPTPEVAAALLMLAFADFGDNNEAGLWMFTGMAVRLVQELGLHRERSCLDKDESVEKPVTSTEPSTKSRLVTFESYQESSEVLLFWTVFAMDTALCNGTGRVPSLKRHEINVRLPLNSDLGAIRAGPGHVAKADRIEVFPRMAKIMLSCAQSIDFINTGASQIRFQSEEDNLQRLDRIETLKQNLIREYRSLPKEVSWAAIFYRAAVNSGQAGAYLLLHLQYHCQIAFLAQESLSDQRHDPKAVPATTQNGEKSRLFKVNQELYRKAIKCIADTVTFTRLIDERPLLAVVYLNQPIFHAACAYSRDMLDTSPNDPAPQHLSSSAFPLPSDSSPSMVFPDGTVMGKMAETPRPRKRSQQQAMDFLHLIAKANYQFLRQTIKDQANIYAGSGWVDAVLDQRETGLRDVDLSIVSNSISTFIRLHDLRTPPGAEAALQKVSTIFALSSPTSNCCSSYLVILIPATGFFRPPQESRSTTLLLTLTWTLIHRPFLTISCILVGIQVSKLVYRLLIVTTELAQYNEFSMEDTLPIT